MRVDRKIVEEGQQHPFVEAFVVVESVIITLFDDMRILLDVVIGTK